MKLSRRSFIMTSAAAVVGSAAVSRGLRIVDEANAAVPGLRWHKAPCRYCGTGCGVEVGVRDGRAMVVRGDAASSVNGGLLCAKGYGLAEMLASGDRLKQPMVRDASGALVAVTWDEALDLIADRWAEIIARDGPDAVAMYGSGQWTIPDAYAAVKLMKGGVRTNNIEVNARLCMAAAVVGYLTTYGVDEPAGSYDDFDLVNDVFLWGSNIAEAHPVIYERLVERRAAAPDLRIINLTTFGQMTSEAADETLLIKPHADLYLANAIAHVLVHEGLINQRFIDDHLVFKTTVAGEDSALDLAGYTAFLDDFAPGAVADAVGIGSEDIERLARRYGDATRATMSLWTMGVNHSTRGVWVNNLLHNLHLLTGKVAKPGNGPFSLSGQASACGSCREVGAFSHRLPADRVVSNAEHRAEVEEAWGLPPGTIPGPEQSPITHAVELWQKAASGQIKSIWVSATNPFQSLPNLDDNLAGIGSTRPFLVVSDAFPSLTVQAADVVLPAACWVEKEGMFGNSERRTQHWEKMVEPPGEAKPDVWQFVEVGRRLAQRLGWGVELFPSAWDTQLERALYDEYRALTLGTAHDVASYQDLVASRGLRWPVMDGQETTVRFNAAHDPNVARKADGALPSDGIYFYGMPDGRAVVWARPYEAPAEVPDASYPFWLSTGRLLEHWHTGTMTQRVRTLHRVVGAALCYLNESDASTLGVRAGDTVRVQSRRGSIVLTVAKPDCRTRCPPGYVWVPFFDVNRLINRVTLGALDPMSKEPDFKKCAVRITKVSS
ncbi:MAG: molybdopterin-dependent oxidoreductase [Deltaproteobacteria bacterium]|nr:molybdopterin-dependent oxidoreductase [Deltaproteobacteria bacterium]